MKPPNREGRAAYAFRGGLYLNLTNRCPTACRFCAKRDWDWSFRGEDLLLSREPSVEQAWAQLWSLAAKKRVGEIVFCGYGEPTYRLPALTALAARAKTALPRARLRLNTVGLGNLIWKRDVVPALTETLDAVSVSLNTADPAQWLELHAPSPRFRAEGFSSACDFTARCVRAGLETTVTAVEQPGVDLRAVKRLAVSLGARFRLRPALT